MPSLRARGEIPPIVRTRYFLPRNLVFSHRKLAVTLLCRTRYVLFYIKNLKLQFWNSKYVFFLSVLSEANA